MGAYFTKDNSIFREKTENIDSNRIMVYNNSNDDKNRQIMKWVIISQNGRDKKIYLRSLKDKIQNIKQQDWDEYNKLVEEILDSEIFIKIKRSDKRKSSSVCEFYENMGIVIKTGTTTLKWYDNNSYLDDGTINKSRHGFCFELEMNNLIFEHDDHGLFRYMMKKSFQDLKWERILNNLHLFKNNYGKSYTNLSLEDCHKIYCFVRKAYLLVEDLPFPIDINFFENLFD